MQCYILAFSPNRTGSLSAPSLAHSLAICKSGHVSMSPRTAPYSCCDRTDTTCENVACWKSQNTSGMSQRRRAVRLDGLHTDLDSVLLTRSVTESYNIFYTYSHQFYVHSITWKKAEQIYKLRPSSRQNLKAEAVSMPDTTVAGVWYLAVSKSLFSHRFCHFLGFLASYGALWVWPKANLICFDVLWGYDMKKS